MNSATYSPEDNKLRLYVGRVPRDEYEKLRADGWTSTPKQSCDFVATWTPSRVATCLKYADLVEDEDQGPEDRAADRAERFGEYRDKRTEEATGHADRYDAGPTAHGFQSAQRAERAASRHDRIAGHACDAWSKAEYWQRRTAGVIAHALHLSSPAVRMGRIKTIEAEQRKHLEKVENYRAEFARWQRVAAETDPEKAHRMAYTLANHSSHGYHYHHPRPESATAYDKQHGTSLHSLLTQEADPITGAEAAALWLAGLVDPTSAEYEQGRSMQWARHFELRLAYENQMLAAQGGRAAFVEMEPGGWIGGRQVQKVNKSNATGRVVSVEVHYRSLTNRWGNAFPDGKEHELSALIKTERLAADAYRPPTDEERAAFHAAKKAAKAAAPKAPSFPLVNPTDEDAERLQAAWNERARDAYLVRNGSLYGKEWQPSTVCRLTQATYSANSKGAYARTETRGLCRDMKLEPRKSNMWSAHEEREAKERGPKVCDLRTTASDGHDYGARRVIVLTDKPQKPLPREVWTPAKIATPAPEGELFAL